MLMNIWVKKFGCLILLLLLLGQSYGASASVSKNTICCDPVLMATMQANFSDQNIDPEDKMQCASEHLKNGQSCSDCCDSIITVSIGFITEIQNNAPIHIGTEAIVLQDKSRYGIVPEALLRPPLV